jgi:hypothetical protein
MILVNAVLLAVLAPQIGPQANVVDLGGGSAGATGVPRLSIDGAAAVGRPFELRIEGGAPGALAVVAGSASSSPLHLPGFGATAHPVAPYASLIATVLDAAGSSPALIAVPVVDASHVGITLVVQGLVADVGAQGGLAFTAAKEIVVGHVDERSWRRRARYAIGAVDELAAQDVDGDGDDDLVTAATTFAGFSEQVLFALDAGDFDLGPPSTEWFWNPAPPTALADVDGDGLLDVVRVTRAPHGLSIRLGSANGVFVATPHFPIGHSATTPAVGDFDGDASADVLVGTATGVLLCHGLGDGTLGSTAIVASETDVLRIHAADFDGDGVLDYVAVRPSAVEVRLGMGAGAFGSAQLVDAGNESRRVLVRDFDGDGELDLAIARASADAVDVRLGRGDGTFDAPRTFGVGRDPVDLDASDLDGDGALDLVVSCRQDGFVEIHHGAGDGSFGFATRFECSATQELVGAAVGDFDADSQADVVFHDSSGFATVHFGLGGGAFESSVEQSVGAAVLCGRAGDVDLDGAVDLVIGHAGTTGVSVLLGDGQGALAHVASVGLAFDCRDVALGDLDLDGHPDVVAATGSDVVVLRGYGDGTFEPPVAHAFTSFVTAIELADVDEDGRLDVLVALEHPASVSVLRGTGSAQLALGTITPLANDPSDMAVVDFDRDGHVDVVTTQWVAGTVVGLRGLGDGTFATPTTLATIDTPHGLAFADLDDNGLDDLVVASTFGGGFAVLLQVGASNFVPAPFVTTGHEHFHVELADMDGDGLVDIVGAPNSSCACSAIVRGNGDGTFAAEPIFHASNSALMLVADFDVDTAVDIASFRYRYVVGSNAGVTSDVAVLANPLYR